MLLAISVNDLKCLNYKYLGIYPPPGGGGFAGGYIILDIPRLYLYIHSSTTW